MNTLFIKPTVLLVQQPADAPPNYHSHCLTINVKADRFKYFSSQALTVLCAVSRINGLSHNSSHFYGTAHKKTHLNVWL